MSSPLPPSLSYLYRPSTAVIAANGTATITFRPDVGQYWLPTLVHVGTRTGNQARCALNAGGVAGLNDNTSQKDFTFQGSNDTSTILSGTVIAYGEGIACRFSAGFAGDIAFAEVIGLSSDIPPTEGIVPEIPGARFAGASPSGLQSSLIVAPISANVPGGGAFFPSAFDLRGFQSYGLAFDIQTTNNGTAPNPLFVKLGWSDDGSIAHVVFEQQYEMFAADKNGVFGINGRFEIQDNCHGAFLTPFIGSQGPDNLNMVLDLFGSARTMGGIYLRNPQSNGAPSNLNGFDVGKNDTFLSVANSIAGGGNTTIYHPMKPGPGTLYMQAGASPSTWFFVYPDNTLMDFYTIPANTTTKVSIVFPASAFQVVINNTGGVLANYTFVSNVSRALLG
jgi:hypothetical protein